IFLAHGTVVTTEPEVRLRQGLPGSVPCTVTRKLSAVDWKKGDTIESATTVAKLDISDSNGAISGPGFEDERFTVASNYSLIFNTARSEDSGRYFCEVSDYETGSLYINHSDVTVFDPPVITDDRRVLQYGERAILRCQYEEPVYGVSWRKGGEYTEAEPLVALDLFYEVNQREGPGYDKGWYNISEDYSLVINSARIRDRGRYFCAVSDLATGRLLVNSTSVDVMDPPVITDARRVLQYGDRATLKCQYEEAVNAVYWLKGDTYADAELLVLLDLFQEISDRKGPGYDQGWYNISEDYSLVINSTRIQDRGKHFCAVLDLTTGSLLSNSTYVEVVGSGLPFGSTRTTQAAFTPATVAGSQTDANNIVTSPVSVKGACE
ncbi:roundabout homolog 2-like, partial [Diadema antillarum]|uniref:roundabout homolog 2-like n=1 Tax=Diadema antillarum TaxID=105358 RepID=UPI003A8419C7